MSELQLCLGTYARHPFYAKELGIRLYSAEELSYYILQNPFILEDDFVDDNLLTFISEELSLPELAEKFAHWRTQTEPCVLWTLMLREMHYCTEQELQQFARQAETRRNAKPWEMKLNKADYLAESGRYKKAVKIYDQLIARDQAAGDPLFYARVLHNKGVCLGRLFELQAAADCLAEAHRQNPEADSLHQLFFLKQMDPAIQADEELLGSISAQTQYRWKNEFDAAVKTAVESESCRTVSECFRRADERRPAVIRGVLGDWKQEYRHMSF